jgi:hypothetical protein
MLCYQIGIANTLFGVIFCHALTWIASDLQLEIGALVHTLDPVLRKIVTLDWMHYHQHDQKSCEFCTK